MAKIFLITRPNHDTITSYLHDFCKDALNAIKTRKDIHVTDLEGSEANRRNVENSLSKENPGLVCLNGHGNKKSVAGYKEEVILDEHNIELTKDKIVYALACNSLEKLGPIAIQYGTKTYIGYRSSFMLVHDPSRTTIPSKDKNALPFKNACNTLLKSLLSGSTATQAIEKTKAEYMHSIRSFGTSEDDPYGDVSLIRFALAWNLEYLDLCGDTGAVF